MRFIFCLVISLFPAFGFCDEKNDVVEAYALRVFSLYDQSLQGAVRIQAAVEALVQNPSDLSLANARQVWLAERNVYSLTEVFRFYGGPIDGENGPEGDINSWPLDEAYIDYVIDPSAPEGIAYSGIVNDTAKYPVIDKDLLRALNGLDGEANVSTGYHAIEFLLWGQDFEILGAGHRPASDYIVGQGVNADRRAQYIKAAAEILVEDLASVKAAWDLSNPTSYATEFVNPANVDQSLTNILLGAYKLAADELSQERMFVAYDSQQQEDEHSCFSDNTHNDLIYNYKGIADMLSTVSNKSGASIISLVAQKNPDKAQSLLSAINGYETEVEKDGVKLSEHVAGLDELFANIPHPIDQAITSPTERPQLLAIIRALEDLGTDVQEAAKEFNITLQ